MPVIWLCRGAYRKVAPFAFLVLASVGTQAAPLCPADRVDERVVVSHVYDGDTVRLSDGRKLRVIGLDTPEVGHGGAPSQPLAEEARTALTTKLGSSHRLALRYDAERHDQYGRTLAHAFLPDGSDLAAEMLAAGYASTLAVPPNLWNLDCHTAVEQSARQAGRGVWKLRPYRGVESVELRSGTEGFHRVSGRVTRVGEGKKSVWVNLEGGLAVRIPREHLARFDAKALRGLRGRRVTVRGRIYANGERLQITVQHPSALNLQP